MNNRYLYLIISILLLVLWFKNCKGNNDKIIETVTVKEVKGNFEPKSVVQTPITENNFIPKNPIGQNMSKKELEYWKTEAERMYKEYELMSNDFWKYNDSTQQAKYKEAIQVTYFSQTRENDTIKIDVYGLASGEINFMAINYKIEERKVEIKRKQLFLRVLAGAEIGLNKEMNQGTYKLNLNLQNSSNDIFSGSYQKINGQDYFLAGYTKSLFSIYRKD